MLKNIEKLDRKLKVNINKEKLILAKNKKTPINVLDELLLEDVAEIRVEIYKRKDFKDIKNLLKNVNKQEYEFFNVAIDNVLKFERYKFLNFKISSICIIAILSFILYISLEISKFLIMSNIFK